MHRYALVPHSSRGTLMALLFFVALLLRHSRCDFGDAVVYEAVDLSAAHDEDREEEAKSIESLLHWAIGRDRAIASACMLEQRMLYSRHLLFVQSIAILKS